MELSSSSSSGSRYEVIKPVLPNPATAISCDLLWQAMIWVQGISSSLVTEQMRDLKHPSSEQGRHLLGKQVTPGRASMPNVAMQPGRLLSHKGAVTKGCVPIMAQE